ncbi:MAG: hypothetical protein ACXABX_01970 [Candidatus Thorarchaeota archaeon]|jgi:hypothetical protein
MGKWNLRDYVETIKLSVRFTRTHYLSIFLAILGVFVITFSLFLLILFIGSIPLSIVYGPFDEFFDAFDYIGDALAGVSTVGKVGAALFIVSSLLAPFLIAIGALFGLGQEIIESGTVTAEETLLWYRQKFTRLAGGGVVQFLYIFGPILMEYVLAAWYFGNQTVPVNSLAILIILAYLWFLFSGGMLSMVFPSIVDGVSFFSSIKHSMKLTSNNLRAVFSIWITFSSLVLTLLIPFIMQDLADLTIMAEQWYDLYILATGLVLVLLVLPVYVLSTTRTYLIISDPNVQEVQENNTEVSQ